jgi:hypothetical protein
VPTAEAWGYVVGQAGRCGVILEAQAGYDRSAQNALRTMSATEEEFE